jgi:hypothetical protein
MSLPILSSQFFENHAPDLGFFSKWRALFQWNAQILPIYEWSNILYVGCLQPPQNFPEGDHKIVFILCDPEALRRLWDHFEGVFNSGDSASLHFSSPESLRTVPSVPLFTEPPAEFALDLSKAPGAEAKVETNPGVALEIEATRADHPADSLGLNKPSATETSNEVMFEMTVQENEDDFSQELASDTLLEAPEEIELSFPDLSNETAVETAIEIPNLPNMEETVKALPEGESFTIEIDSSAPTAIPVLEPVETEVQIETKDVVKEQSLEEALEASSDVELAPEEGSQVHNLDEEGDELLDLNLGTSPTEATGSTGSLSSPLVTLKPLTDATVKVTPEKPAVKQEDLTPLNSVPPNAQQRAAPSKSEVLMKGDGVDKFEVTRFSVQALKSATPEQTQSWTEKLFASIAENYQKSMILLKSGDQVKPWKWDQNFKPSTPAVSSVSLLQPSPFRIVHRTHKPFHGYVAPNDLNQKFFDQWNNSEIPELLTVAPVMVEDHVIGMLLAIGDKKADTKACLQSMELLADGIAKEIKASKNKAA